MKVLRRGLSHDSRSALVSLPTYGPPSGVRTKPNLVFSHGQGALMWDTAGKEYLDFSAGIAVNVLGHSDEGLARVLTSQALKISHVSNLYHTEENLRLHEKLIELSPGFAKVFLCNSGTEANEAALKFAALRAFAKGDDRSRIIAFKSSFHGRTLGALSVTYKPAIRAPFQSLLHQNVDFVTFNDLEAVKDRMDKDVLAIIVEPVQGEGGVNPAQPEFLKGLRSLCDCYGSTLIFDEIQIGLGRGGTFWGHQNKAYGGVVPDVLTAAKPLAGGLPVGATLLHKNFYADVPEGRWAGSHGTTFGGNPLISRVAVEVLSRLEKPEFMQQVRKSGAALCKGLLEIQKRHPEKVKQIRRPLGDEGLYAGVWLSSPVAGKIVLEAMEKSGVVFITAGDYGDTIRICPPLIVSVEQVERACMALEAAIFGVDFPAPAPTAAKNVVSTIQRRPVEQFKFKSVKEYHNHIDATCPLPPGFRTGADKLSFVPKELGPGAKSFPMRLSLISLENDNVTLNYAAVFTKNAFPGAPIRVAKEIVASGAPIAGVLINNKVSNVHPRGGGIQDSRSLVEEAAKAMGLSSDAKIIPASTGVIGWGLPVKEMVECIPRVVKASNSSGSALIAAEAIMTTDRYPKARSETVKIAGSSTLGRITGIAKGAGMIEPNMATMLVYIMTDISLPGKVLQRALEKAVNGPGSFNRITVDSDQSTSDMAVLLSSNKIEALEEKDFEAFTLALCKVCSNLAEDIVRNGEGTKHVIRVAVTGAPTLELAHGVGKAVANSPLVKTAIFGNDPNVGRIIAALGSYLGKQRSFYVAKKLAQKTVVKVGGVVVFENGEFALDSEKEKVLNQMMRDCEMDYSAGDFPPHDRVVDIHIDLNGGEHETVVIGSDLSPEYVEVNGNYRS